MTILAIAVGRSPSLRSASDRAHCLGMTVAAPPSAALDFISEQVTSARRFYLNLKPRAPRQLTVVCGGSEDCAEDFVVDRATFPYWSIEFVAAGKGELTLAGKAHPLEPGTVFCYGPNIAHRIRTEREPRLVKYFVDFIGAPSLKLLKLCGLAPGRVSQVTAIGDVRNAFDSLIRFGLQQDRHTVRLCALQLELLLRIIARSKQAAGASERRARATFERVRQYMDAHFLEVASVHDVAVGCHLDSSHLSRLLRRFHGESPLRYLQRRRMQWAADRLQGSQLLVRQIADELEIDQFQFSRTFKRIHGVSPTEFLKART